MSPQRSLALLVAAAMMSLAVLAHASPPDPDWIGGFWEDDDYDDVVFYTTSFSAAETAPLCALRPYWTPIWILPLEAEPSVPAREIPPHHPRGPPLA